MLLYIYIYVCVCVCVCVCGRARVHILFCLIYVIVLSVLQYPSFYLLSRPIITSFPHLRFHLLKEHRQNQSSRWRITYTRCRLYWVAPYSSLMTSSHKLLTSMLLGIQLQRWGSAPATSFLSDNAETSTGRPLTQLALLSSTSSLQRFYQNVNIKYAIRHICIVLH